MQPTDDSALLRQYADNHSDDAFAALVTRHVSLVYSVALRQVGNPHHAEEITQAVFIILARKAAELHRAKALSSWLFQTTRLTANNFVRSELRRHHREQEAYMRCVMNDMESETWKRIEPLLDAAVAALREKDRRAVLLRFYEGNNLRQVGVALDVSEDAAEKRVNRALEKLRKFFAKRGISSTTGSIAKTISANSVQAAPMALAKSVTALALSKGAAASTSTLTLIKGALKIMAWTKAKSAIVAGVFVLLAAGTVATVAVKERNTEKTEKLWRINKTLPSAVIDQLPPMVQILPTKFDPPWVNWNSGSEGNKFAGARARADIIASFAYGFPLGRIHFATEIPPERFDFVATLPHGSREALQRWLRTTLGLVGRQETNDMDVLLLKVSRANAPGLRPPILGKSDEYEKPGVFHSSNEPIDTGAPRFTGLAEYLERYFEMPVIDETGLTGRYSIDLRWKEQKGHPNPEGLKQVLRSWLGLELVPAHRPVVTLVMGKSNS